MEQVFITFLFLLARYFHIIAAAFLIGGTLFYELIVPVAINELKDEQKPWVFARARWAFRWIVWCSALVLLISGGVSTYRNWFAYNGTEATAIDPMSNPIPSHSLQGAGYWWAAHAVLGVAGVGLAVALILGGRPPRYPLLWMRINLVILLLVIFLGSVTRDIRLRMLETHVISTTGLHP